MTRSETTRPETKATETRARLAAIARRNLADAQADTITAADSIMEIPVTHYTDAERWELEVEQIFRRLPLLVAFSGELKESGSYKAMDVVGTPLLLSRDRDGNVNAFVNMCSHRGAQLLPAGGGQARSFACPYHAWTYNLGGDLVAVTDNELFGEFDADCHGLTKLPVTERHGFIFVMLRPNPVIDFDTAFAKFDEVLSYLDLADASFAGSQQLDGPNWKICYDGYLDLYHLPILHKNTFGPDFPNRANYDAWGPHQKVGGPNLELAPYADLPDDQLPTKYLAGGLNTFFPHVSIAAGASKDGSIMVSQLFPGTDVGSSITIQNFLVRGQLTPEVMKGVEESMEFLHHVVANEDYATCHLIQDTLRTGAKETIMFGRNEGGGQNFHGWVDRLVATDDADLASLYS